MKNIFTILFLFLISFLNAQQTLKGLVLDKDTYKPIEFVDVYNEFDYTITNSEGKFLLSIKEPIINFNIIGYEKFSIDLNQIKPDTIFLKKKAYELEEIVIYNEKALIKKVFKAIYNNYTFLPYNEAFFLRSLLKKNNEIIKLQDISGILSRKTLLATSKKPMPKNNYQLLVNNMRKAGIAEQEIYFEMFSFKKLLNSLTSIYISPKFYDFRESPMKNSDLIKLNFSPKPSSNYKSKGYYIVNSSDYAFNEFYLIDEFKNRPYIESSGIKYRTTRYELLIIFKKDENDKKYYINKAKINATVEVVNDDSEEIIYDTQYQWFGMNKVDTAIKKNVPSKKDIFKIDKPYNNNFWKLQNTLLLTKEMKSFINKLNSSDKNEFRYVSNMDN